jgi:hypothetical protein
MMESDADVYMDDMVSDFSDGDVSLDDNSFAAENRAPVTKKSKATVTKKTTKKAHKNAEDAQSISVLTSTENLANLPAPTLKAAAGKKKTVEETYQKMSQLEHILIRPDTYSTYTSEAKIAIRLFLCCLFAYSYFLKYL